jgi:adenylate cyclase
MIFRIGINLGDVIEEGDRIYGDGVNIAARLEGLAEQGGICISGSAYDQIKNKLPFTYEYQGEQSVKNIEEPVRVYRVMMAPEATGNFREPQRSESKRLPRVALSIGLSCAIGVFIVAGWYYFLKPTHQEAQPALGEKPLVKEPHIPPIAVLPFKNLSGDSEQEYFSDGITNDIITALSKFSNLLVIASNTVFTYKGKAVKVQDVGRELGIRYVVEGSVQKANDKVRISAQLIGVATGHHLWAERYDRSLKDLFKVQDEIVGKIVAKLDVKISEAERSRAMRKDTDSLAAYDYYLRGVDYLNRKKAQANRDARRMFEKAIELDPQYASAYSGVSWTHFRNVGHGWTEFADQSLQLALDFAQKALELDPINAEAYDLKGSVHIFQAQYALAINELNRAIELNPNNFGSYNSLGWILLWSGRTDEAIIAMEKSVRLDVKSKSNVFLHLGYAYYLKDQYIKALESLEKGVVQRPNFVGYYIALAATYAQLGRLKDAERNAATVLRLDPFFELDSFGTAYRNPTDRGKILEGLRKAGLK